MHIHTYISGRVSVSTNSGTLTFPPSKRIEAMSTPSIVTLFGIGAPVSLATVGNMSIVAANCVMKEVERGRTSGSEGGREERKERRWERVKEEGRKKNRRLGIRKRWSITEDSLRVSFLV